MSICKGVILVADVMQNPVESEPELGPGLNQNSGFALHRSTLGLQAV